MEAERPTDQKKRKETSLEMDGMGGVVLGSSKIRVMVAPHHPTQHKTKQIEDLHKTKRKWRPRNQETNKVENITEGGEECARVKIGFRVHGGWGRTTQYTTAQ